MMKSSSLFRRCCTTSSTSFVSPVWRPHNVAGATQTATSTIMRSFFSYNCHNKHLNLDKSSTNNNKLDRTTIIHLSSRIVDPSSAYRRMYSSNIRHCFRWNNTQSSSLLPSTTTTTTTTIGSFSRNSFFRPAKNVRFFASKRHKRLLKYAKGFRGRSKNCFTIAIRRVEKSWQYAYRDRRVKHRLYRKLWIMRIQAAVRQYNISYSRFIPSLQQCDIQLNRKVLAELAANEPFSFKSIVDVVSSNNSNSANNNEEDNNNKID